MSIYIFKNYKNKKIDSATVNLPSKFQHGLIEEEFDSQIIVKKSSSERLYEIIFPFLYQIENQNLLPNIFPSKVNIVFYRSNDFLEKLLDKFNNFSILGIKNKIANIYNKPLGSVRQRYSYETYEIKLNAEMLSDFYFKYKRHHDVDDLDYIRYLYGGEEKLVNSVLAHEFGHIVFGEMIKGGDYLKANNSLSDSNNLFTIIMKNLTEGFADVFSFYLLDRISPIYYQQKDIIEQFREESNSRQNYHEYYIENIKSLYNDKTFTNQINDDLSILFEITKENLRFELAELFKNNSFFKIQLEKDFHNIYKQHLDFNSEKDVLQFIDLSLIPNYFPQEIDTLNSQKAAYMKELTLKNIKKLHSYKNLSNKNKLKN